jgi:hypothetical protein
MPPALVAALLDLEHDTIRAQRGDLLIDLDHAVFILEHICEQLVERTSHHGHPDGCGEER